MLKSKSITRYILLGLLVLAISSCNPFIDKALRKKNKCNDKLEKLVLKCPDLLKKDTVLVPFEVIVPEIRVDTFIKVNDDVSGIDSVIAMFKGDIDSLTVLKLTERIKWYVKERPCLIDTLDYEKYGVQVKVYQNADGIQVSFYKPEEVIKEEVEVEVQTVTKIELTTMEKIRNFLGDFWSWLILIGIIGLIFWIANKKFKLL